MIRKECFTAEWIDKVSADLNYNDKNLIEKVIRALSLLEMLVESGCPLIFKGGTALMLLLGKTVHRLSIDIDIVCPPGTDIEKYLERIEDYGFLKFELVERKQRSNRVPKSHSKVFYQVELSYRGSDMDVERVYDDIRQTALCVATRGMVEKGHFALLQEGIKKIKPFMYLGHYYIEDAIIDCVRAAYLVTSIEKGNNVIERYSGNPLEVRDMRLTPALTNKLNRLKVNLPEAFFY